jgi:TetR/AcrR family fatty acid metabolism transcriptional regulator
MLDEESLDSFVMNENKKTLPDFPKIMDLVEAMILRPSFGKKETRVDNENKKKLICNAAERILAEKGYASATMGHIAREVGISEGSIYTHFKSKEELLFYLPCERFEWFKMNMADAFNNNRNPLNKLYWFMRIFYRIFLSNMDFLKVFLFSVKLNKGFYGSPAYSTYLSYVSEFECILNEGKRTGFVRKEVDSRVCRNFFLGAFFHLTTRWMLFEQIEMTEVMQQWDEVIFLLLRSVARNQEDLQVGSG